VTSTPPLEIELQHFYALYSCIIIVDRVRLPIQSYLLALCCAELSYDPIINTCSKKYLPEPASGKTFSGQISSGKMSLQPNVLRANFYRANLSGIKLLGKCFVFVSLKIRWVVSFEYQISKF
jgi:hypothetical protein